MADRKPIDIAVIFKSRDDNGELLTQTLPDGTVVPSPLIVTRNYSEDDMPEIRLSFWDLDHQALEVRLEPRNDGMAFDEFARLQHGRMQELVRNGQLQAILNADASERRIAELERQLASSKQNGGGVINLMTQD